MENNQWVSTMEGIAEDFQNAGKIILMNVIDDQTIEEVYRTDFTTPDKLIEVLSKEEVDYIIEDLEQEEDNNTLVLLYDDQTYIYQLYSNL